MRERRLRLPRIYLAAFVRGNERRTFRASGWNKDDAYVAARRQLEALGEHEGGTDGKGWWCVGVETQK